MFIKILVGWPGAVCIEQKPKHNGKMETKLYQQSGCDVKRTSLYARRKILCLNSRAGTDEEGEFYIDLPLATALSFLGLFSS